jgi:hypothetical protein
MITRSNYEQWAVDYLDGQLTAEQKIEMKLFLQQNPDIAQELEGIVWTSLPIDEQLPVLEDKACLKHNLIRLDNYEMFALDYVENNLTTEIEQEMAVFLTEQTTIATTLENFSLQAVPADMRIVYPHKESLKKQRDRRAFLLPIFRYGAAAVLLLLLVGQVFRAVYVAPIKQTAQETRDPQVQNQTTNERPLPNANLTTENRVNAPQIATSTMPHISDNKVVRPHTVLAHHSSTAKNQLSALPINGNRPKSNENGHQTIADVSNVDNHRLKSDVKGNEMGLNTTANLVTTANVVTKAESSAGGHSNHVRTDVPALLPSQTVTNIAFVQYPVFHISTMPPSDAKLEQLLTQANKPIKHRWQQFLGYLPESFLPETVAEATPVRTKRNVVVGIPVSNEMYHLFTSKIK